jgi:hypothetical protein
VWKIPPLFQGLDDWQTDSLVCCWLVNPSHQHHPENGDGVSP